MSMAMPRPLARAAPVTRTSGWSMPDRLLPHLLLWPAMIALALVFAYPLAWSFWLSLNAYNITRAAGLRRPQQLPADSSGQPSLGEFSSSAFSLPPSRWSCSS